MTRNLLAAALLTLGIGALVLTVIAMIDAAEALTRLGFGA